MSGIGSFLRSYEFLDLTKSVTESKMALYKQPNKTWGDIGNKFASISYYNALSVGAVGADVATYLAISSLRSVGLFCPLPPEPPVFPAPFDNVQFIDGAIKRALWDWNLTPRKEIEEGIETSYSEKWNVFQVVGEWSIAYSLENMGRSSYFKPTFLTISEPLENGATFLSVSAAFAWLWQSDQKAILHALYHQTEAPALGYRARQVYQDIRGLASKLHQGNQNYLDAFSQYAAKIPSAPIAAPAPAPSYQRPAQVHPVPSAPPLSRINPEMAMALNVAFLRSSLSKLPSQDQKRIKSELLGRSNMSQDSLKYLMARLALLKAFESKSERPAFLPWESTLQNGKTFRQAVQEFDLLRRSDFVGLYEAALDSWREYLLSPSQKERMDDLNGFGRIFAKQQDFLKLLDALRIDLLAT